MKDISVCTYVSGKFDGFLLIGHDTVEAGNAIHVGLLRDSLTFDFVTHRLNGETVWPDEFHSGIRLW